MQGVWNGNQYKKDYDDGNEWKGKDEQEATVCDVGWNAFGTGDSS